MIVSLYAVTKAGATYIPIEPELPEARIGFMLEDTGASLVLVDTRSRPRSRPDPGR